MFPQLIEKLGRHEDLTMDEASAAMAEVMEGTAAPAQIAGLLIGLAMKGERPGEIVGLARTIRERSGCAVAAHTPIPSPERQSVTLPPPARPGSRFTPRSCPHAR